MTVDTYIRNNGFAFEHRVVYSDDIIERDAHPALLYEDEHFFDEDAACDLEYIADRIISRKMR